MLLTKEELEYEVSRVLESSPELIRVIKEKYQTEGLWELCIDKDPELFKYAKNPSQSLSLFAVKCDGINLKHVPPNMINETICYYAVSSNPIALKYVPKIYLTEGLKELAFDQAPHLMKYYSNIRREYLIQKIKRSPANIQFIKNPDDELKCIAIAENPNVILYFKKLSQKMMDVIDELYPELRNQLPNYTRSISQNDE